MIETIEWSGRLLALIVSHKFNRPGVSFLTSGELSQQLAFIAHPAGHTIEPHVHNPVRREVQLTQETLFIKRGKIRVDFYDDEQRYLESRVTHCWGRDLAGSGGPRFRDPRGD